MALAVSIHPGSSPKAHIRSTWPKRSHTRPQCSTTVFQTRGARRYGVHRIQHARNVCFSPTRISREGRCPCAVVDTSDADSHDSRSPKSDTDTDHRSSTDCTSESPSSSAPSARSHPSSPPTLSPISPPRKDSSSPQDDIFSVADWVMPSEGEFLSVSEIEYDSQGTPPLLPSASYSGIVFLASLGVVGTAYLAFQKVTGGSVACQVGGSCGSVLDSPWGTLLGVPLSLYGCFAYGLTAALALRPAKWLVLGAASVLTATSAYLLFILTTQLGATFCLYCFASAALSLSLLLLAYQGLSKEEVKAALVPQAGLATAVILGLSVAFGDVRQGAIDLPPVMPAVTTESPAPVLSLAKHLQAVGAQMYGAFWCSHCYEQKQMFGRQAMEYVAYVECYPEGYRSGVQIAAACKEADIQGFPTWIVKGQVLSGEQGLDQLAEASGFDTSSLGID